MSKKSFFFLKIISIITISSLFNISLAKADFSDGLLLKPALTLELQFPEIQAQNLNSDFINRPAEKQLKALDNISLGLNFRLHKYFGLNLNWSQFTLKNSSINGYILNPNRKADISIENINFSSLFYLPIISDTMDAFIEIGASDINFDYNFIENSGTMNAFKDHETALLYGAGIEFSPYDLNMAFRLSAQKYMTKLTPINGDIFAYRAGIVKYF